jgi:hypothetical protein
MILPGFAHKFLDHHPAAADQKKVSHIHGGHYLALCAQQSIIILATFAI